MPCQLQQTCIRLKEASTCLAGQRPRGLKLREAARNRTSPPLPTRLKQPAGPVFQVSSEAPLPYLEGMPTMASSFNDLEIARHGTGGSKALVPLPGPGRRMRPPSPTRLYPRRPPRHAHYTTPLLRPTAAQRAASSLKTPRQDTRLTAHSLLEPLSTLRAAASPLGSDAHCTFLQHTTDRLKEWRTYLACKRDLPIIPQTAAPAFNETGFQPPPCLLYPASEPSRRGPPCWLPITVISPNGRAAASTSPND